MVGCAITSINVKNSVEVGIGRTGGDGVSVAGRCNEGMPRRVVQSGAISGTGGARREIESSGGKGVVVHSHCVSCAESGSSSAGGGRKRSASGTSVSDGEGDGTLGVITTDVKVVGGSGGGANVDGGGSVVGSAGIVIVVGGNAR